MQQANTELAESIHQFITIWKMIGRPFPKVDQTDEVGLAITWPDTHFPFYNALFLTERLTDAQALQGRVQEAAAYMRARPTGLVSRSVYRRRIFGLKMPSGPASRKAKKSVS